MPARRYKPMTAGPEELLCADARLGDEGEAGEELLAKLHKTGGRNNNGRITTRHIGGGTSGATGS
jgi:large subunit ribosomal protein L2